MFAGKYIKVALGVFKLRFRRVNFGRSPGGLLNPACLGVFLPRCLCVQLVVRRTHQRMGGHDPWMVPTVAVWPRVSGCKPLIVNVIVIVVVVSSEICLHRI